MQEDFGAFISDDELASYKKSCIEQLGKLLQYNTKIQLGSVEITVSNYEEVVNGYTDGNALYEDIESLIGQIDTSNKLYNLVDKCKEALANKDNEKLKASVLSLAEIIPDFVNKNLTISHLLLLYYLCVIDMVL